ncbi:hypothetical protein ON010_g13951 [Phytophthora cinnamomi]|nr:hypothetical protein ON010_g13951 [Phytophthora cinnamomi]
MEDCEKPTHVLHFLQRSRAAFDVLQDLALCLQALRGGSTVHEMPLTTKSAGVQRGWCLRHVRARQAPLPSKNATDTPLQRDFIQEQARESLMPQCILHALTRKLELRPSALPPLCTVQNICSAFSPREGEHDAVTFTNDYDETGLSKEVNGSDARPFLVGMSTKRLLRNAIRGPGTFVLHLDARYTLNCVGYPVLVCGITNASRAFHLIALFTSSQLQQCHFTAALVALRRIYARVNGKEMIVKCVLGDADKVQHNAFAEGFPDLLVFRGIYDLHFSGSEAEHKDRKGKTLREWAGHDDYATFSAATTRQQAKHGTSPPAASCLLWQPLYGADEVLAETCMYDDAANSHDWASPPRSTARERGHAQ